MTSRYPAIQCGPSAGITLLGMHYRGAKIRPRDLIWLAVAVAVPAVLIFGVVTSLTGLRAATPRPWILEAVGIVVGVLFWGWIILGAWRRTIWGAPPGGQRDVIEMRHRARSRR